LIDRSSSLHATLATSQVDLLQAYFELLVRWNRRINLTALPLEPLGDETFDRLILEPIAAAAYVPPTKLTWFDLGSGGGSPAVPMRVLRPESRLTMVEARGKKAAFLREVTRVLDLSNVDVVNTRVEDWSPARHSAELVTARALRINTQLLLLVRTFLSAHGQLLLFGINPAALSNTFREARKVDLVPGVSTLLICSP